MPTYKFATAHQWLESHLKTIDDVDTLRSLVCLFASNMDSDEIQGLFQSEMDADGYFIDLDPVVEVTITSDDGVFTHKREIAEWLHQADHCDLEELIECECGDYPADEVAKFYYDMDEKVKQIIDYVQRVKSDYEVHVDEEQFKNWLQEHKPEMYKTNVCELCNAFKRYYMADTDGTNLEEVFGCPKCD